MNVFDEVQNLYLNSNREMARWMWNNHVQIVADFARTLAIKYHADVTMCVDGALLHDIGDVWMERDDKMFDNKSQTESTRILQNAKYTVSQIEIIVGKIIAPHSCYPNNMPTTLEGKILATADALAHLTTPFYESLHNMGLPKQISLQEFNTWVTQKINRDYHSKIFFEDERTQVKPNYTQLLNIFL